jgi:methylthioribulose-1-phosphate dehydratase
MSESFTTTASRLSSIAKGLHSRGWLLGTSGNLSAVLETDPLRLAITPSGADKGELSIQQILVINEDCSVVDETAGVNHPLQLVQSDGSPLVGKPSDESPLHVAIVNTRGAGAVIHTHSVWSTILSDLNSREGGVTIEGYEMLKGLHGVKTHEHREWIPIIDNSQDMVSLSEVIKETLAKFPDIHALILRRHGLYTWGRDLIEAKRHVEILEFLLEAVGRSKDNGRATG